MGFLAPAIPALVKGAASAAGGALASKLFSGGSKRSNQLASQFVPRGFSAGGITASPFGDVTSSSERRGLVNDISQGFGREAQELGALRARIGPGRDLFTQVQLDELGRGQARALSDLDKNLRQRRVFGSSFANQQRQDVLGEFANLRRRAIAESELAKIDAERQLIPQQLEAFRNQFERQMTELDALAGIGQNVSKVANSAATSFSSSLTKLAELDALAAEKFGAGIGRIGGTLAGGLEDIFTQRRNRNTIGPFETIGRRADGTTF